ncbi:signal transducer and activator of transcription 3.2-like [Babylonia areolata]|uniref:signal transducer and activator of transcription 3.2-like n=1 Tax=Babylonia areolata TaxID=304850 RepID=UPI003FD01DFB
MSTRYQKLQELLSSDSLLDKLSFYPDHLLDLRSILSEWFEAEDWSGTLTLSGQALTDRSQELLQKALSLLRGKKKNAGFEFYVINTETKLKKAYQSQPVKFVEEVHQCLAEEEQLFNTMMSQEQVGGHLDQGQVCQKMSAKDLAARVANCRELDKRVVQVLRAACLCLDKWPADIKSESKAPKDVFGNGETILPPYLVFQGLRQELEQKSQVVIRELNSVLAGLEWFVVQWKTWQLHDCVSRKVDGEHRDQSKEVENMCEQVCGSVYSLMQVACSKELQNVNAVREQLQAPPPALPAPNIIGWFCMALKDLLKKIVEMLLVVRKQPPLTMMIEKEKGQRDKEDINNSKKFITTVGILGGKGFEDGVLISEVEIYLAFSHDLATSQQLNKRPDNAFKIFHDRPDARSRYSSSSGLDSPRLPYERTYEKLRVEHFSRKETKHVYRQLYHVVYTVKLQFPLFLQEFTTQTYSLPIIVRTGANQASEHIGAQLWHSFSSPNVYNLRGEMAPSMRVSEVIQMINERIRFIGGEGLRQHEKDFLRERLHMVAGGRGGAQRSGDATITLDNFIKEKVYLPRHGSAPGTRDVMDFSLWRWLHSIINLLDDPENLKQPWIDGIIYGFASRQQCINALEGSRDGTFLLRFSESFLHGNHIMSKGGLAAVIQKNGQVNFAPPISSDDIEKDGLGNMIASIGCQYLRDTNLTISDLCQKYPASKPPENPTSSRYLGWRKQEFIVPSDTMYGTASIGSPASTDSEVSAVKRERKKPKRPSQKLQGKNVSSSSSGSKQYRTAGPPPPGSPESTTSSFSAASPTSAMSPDPRHGFQAVGVQEFHQHHPSMAWNDGSASPSSSSNIPTTVFTHMNGDGVGAAAEMAHAMMRGVGELSQQTMILQLPENGQHFNQLSEQVQILDISGMCSSGDVLSSVSSTSSFSSPSSSFLAQGSVSNSIGQSQFLLSENDPQLGGVISAGVMLSGNGEQPTLSIEEVEECLKMDT